MSLLQDIRLALRILRRTPVPTLVALLSIVLSVGATAVVFTAVKSVLLDALPYARPAELVQIRSEYANFAPSQSDWVMGYDAEEIVRRTHSLRSLGTSANAVFNLAGDSSSPPEALYGLRVSAGLFPTLGVAPMLGRNILPEEDQAGRDNAIIPRYWLWPLRLHR